MVAKLNTQDARFRAVQFHGPREFGPSEFLLVAGKWLGATAIGPSHPEDGSMILVVNGLARRVSVGDWLVRFSPTVFHVMPDVVVQKLFETNE